MIDDCRIKPKSTSLFGFMIYEYFKEKTKFQFYIHQSSIDIHQSKEVAAVVREDFGFNDNYVGDLGRYKFQGIFLIVGNSSFARFQILDSGYLILDTRHAIMQPCIHAGNGCWLSVIGHWSLVSGNW